MRVWPFLLLGLSSPALAAWPEDITLSAMTEHDGEVVLDQDLLGASYRQLVMELGTMIANKPITPAETLGAYGWDVGLQNQVIMTEAIDRKGEPSPWERAHRDEDNAPYHLLPTLTARKGLPLSTEIGGSVGWIGGSSTGFAGGFARVAVLEGYKPLPDISLKIGYSGYVGNDELDCGVLDLSATIGSTYAVGRLAGVNTARISPWGTFTTLRVSANPVLDEETMEDVGAYRIEKAEPGEEHEPPIVIPQFGGGLQIEAGNVHVRLALTWAPATIPTATTGLGFTF